MPRRATPMLKLFRSYFVRYKATAPGALLLGGVREGESSRFGTAADAELRAEAIRELNKHAAPEVAIVPSVQPPEIYRHCPGAEAQAVGCHCPRCGEVLR